MESPFKMTPKDILLHLRLPFSLFLMPVFWFSISQLPQIDTTKAIVIFVVWHLLIYPASNAFNSYFDKDEGSIGGLEKPPAVDKQLYWVAIVFDVLAVLVSLIWVDVVFAVAVLVYGLVSKAYSHTSIRLKKHPVASWLVVGFFQGFFVYISTQYAFIHSLHSQQILPALLSSATLWAVYPMTQIYQHTEDAHRGDTTLSMVLGIRGTFYFTATVYILTTLGFYKYLSIDHFLLFLVCTSPTLVFFGWWFVKVYKNIAAANFKNTMMLNLIASLVLNVFFIVLMFLK